VSRPAAGRGRDDVCRNQRFRGCPDRVLRQAGPARGNDPADATNPATVVDMSGSDRIPPD